MIKKRRFLFLVVAIMLVATACGDGDVVCFNVRTLLESGYR